MEAAEHTHKDHHCLLLISPLPLSPSPSLPPPLPPSPLPLSLLSRFNDVSPSVRMECIRYSKYFLVYHAHLAGEVAQHLHERFHDREEKVRMESVKVVSEAAADNPKAVPQTVSAGVVIFNSLHISPSLSFSFLLLLFSPSFPISLFLSSPSPFFYSLCLCLSSFPLPPSLLPTSSC